jgi:haloalkane dehalogenase
MGTVQPFQKLYWMHDAPFPSEEYKAGARIFPTLVPIDHDNPESIKNIEAWEKLKLWNKPFLTIFGNEDDIMTGAEKTLQKLIPGAKGQNHAILNAGHFIQEEKEKNLLNLLFNFTI